MQFKVLASRPISAMFNPRRPVCRCSAYANPPHVSRAGPGARGRIRRPRGCPGPPPGHRGGLGWHAARFCERADHAPSLGAGAVRRVFRPATIRSIPAPRRSTAPRSPPARTRRTAQSSPTRTTVRNRPGAARRHRGAGGRSAAATSLPTAITWRGHPGRVSPCARHAHRRLPAPNWSRCSHDRAPSARRCRLFTGASTRRRAAAASGIGSHCRARRLSAVDKDAAGRANILARDAWTTRRCWRSCGRTACRPSRSSGWPSPTIRSMPPAPVRRHRSPPSKAATRTSAACSPNSTAAGSATSTDVLVVSDHGFSTIMRTLDVAAELSAAGFNATRTAPGGLQPGQMLVAGNGGTVLLYAGGHDPALSRRVAAWIQTQDWAGVVFSPAKRLTAPSPWRPCTSIRLRLLMLWWRSGGAGTAAPPERRG